MDHTQGWHGSLAAQVAADPGLSLSCSSEERVRDGGGWWRSSSASLKEGRPSAHCNRVFPGLQPPLFLSLSPLSSHDPTVFTSSQDSFSSFLISEWILRQDIAVQPRLASSS